MCFYVYAPNGNIHIEYMSELIQLEKDGSSTVLVDFLIKESPENPIETLRIIYPNRFYCVDRNATVWQIPNTYFSDITTTFIHDPEGIGWAYDLQGTSVQLISPEEDVGIPKWAKRRIVKQSDPSDPTRDIEFSGMVGGDGELTTEEFEPLQLKILYDINFTVITYKFKQPLEAHPRWVRLKFRGENAAHNLHKTNKRYLKKLTNQLYYQYQVFGPHDVRDRFITYLLSYKRRCEKKDCSTLFLNALIATLHFFEGEGLIRSPASAPTAFEKLFLHIDPGELDRLTDIASQGDVEIAGFLPNIVEGEERKVIHLYQWKAISNAGQAKKDKFKFAVLFQAKPVFLPYYLVPFVGLILAIIALVLRCVPISTVGNGQEHPPPAAIFQPGPKVPPPPSY